MKAVLRAAWAILAMGAASASAQESGDGDWVEPELDRDPVEVKKDDPALKCVCEETGDDAPVILHGLVTGAKTVLGADRRSVQDRMATIFNVQWSSDRFVRGETKVWHVTAPSKCGVTFDYGRFYQIGVEETEDGELQTDACLIKRNGEQNNGNAGRKAALASGAFLS